MGVAIVLGLSVMSGILYRLGGASKEDAEKEWGWIPRWIRRLPKKRDVGCGLACIGGAIVLGVHAPWWVWALAFGLHWAALSTYWDPLFGFDNFWFHGFMVGFSMLPVAFFAEPLAFGIRSFVLAVLMGGWSAYTSNARWEEFGRGFVMPLTLLILLI